MPKISALEFCDKLASILVLILAISVVCGYFSSFSWFFDLLVNFQYQYAFGAVILLLWFTIRKHRNCALLCIALACSALFQIYASLDLTTAETVTDGEFTIVQYNRKYTLSGHEGLKDFIRLEDPDVIVVQEAVHTHASALNELKDEYPHQILEPRPNAFGMIVLSKHPFLEKNVIPFQRMAIDNFLLHFTVQPNGFDPISIYTLHPTPPIYPLHQKQRNSELVITSQAAGEDKTANVIMMGDWNMTPFSPHFRSVLKNGKLKNQHTALYPLLTWPAFFPVPALQIPIDHILHKGNIELIEKRRGHPMRSDHYPVIATFTNKG